MNGFKHSSLCEVSFSFPLVCLSVFFEYYVLHHICELNNKAWDRLKTRAKMLLTFQNGYCNILILSVILMIILFFKQFKLLGEIYDCKLSNNKGTIHVVRCKDVTQFILKRSNLVNLYLYHLILKRSTNYIYFNMSSICCTIF